jgi:hypothetical protein
MVSVTEIPSALAWRSRSSTSSEVKTTVLPPGSNVPTRPRCGFGLGPPNRHRDAVVIRPCAVLRASALGRAARVLGLDSLRDGGISADLKTEVLCFAEAEGERSVCAQLAVLPGNCWLRRHGTLMARRIRRPCRPLVITWPPDRQRAV